MRKKLVWTITFLAGLYFFLEYVVPPEIGGAFDDHGVTDPCILRIEDKYWMWYTGYPEPEQDPRICIATSEDNRTWERGGRPVLKPGATLGADYRGAHSPCVILDGDTYKMWYVGIAYDKQNQKPTAICYAESKDGVKWKKHGAVLPRGQRGEWDDGTLASPSVIKTDDGYLMWYVGLRGDYGKVGLATSRDGKKWKKVGEPVFGPEQAGWECESVSDVHVEAVAVGHAYAMTYVGKTLEDMDESAEERVMVGRLGAATSEDGRQWGRAHMILGPGDREKSFDGLSIDSAATLFGKWVSGVWYSARARDELDKAAKGRAHAESEIAGRIGFAEWSPRMDAFVPTPGEGAGGCVLDVGRASVNTQLSKAQTDMNDFIAVVASFAVLMGLINLTRVHGKSIGGSSPRTFEGFTTIINSSLFFITALAMVVFKIWSADIEQWWVMGDPKPLAKFVHDVLFFDVYMPLGSTMFSLLACYLASAAYRSMRLKSVEAGMLMISATIVMLGQVPVGIRLTQSLPIYLQIPTISEWILFVVNNAACRAMWFGIFIGALAISIRMWLGLERGTFFQKEL